MVETCPRCCSHTAALFRSRGGQPQAPQPSWLPTMTSKAFQTPRVRMQEQCLCSASPPTWREREMGHWDPSACVASAHYCSRLVWGWQHSSKTSGAGGLDQAGSGWRSRHTAFPRPVLPAELLLSSSQNLKPPSPAGSCAAPLPPSTLSLTPGCSCLSRH